MPHPPKSKVFQPYAVPRATWRGSKRLIVSVMKPNNCVKFKDTGVTLYGMVRQIYVYSNPMGIWETALLVNPITNLFPKKKDSPSHSFRYILFLLKSVVGKVDEEFIIVRPEKVVCVAAYRLLPEKTFGIESGGIILRPYDYDAQLDV